MRRQIIGLALGLALLGAGSAQALIIDSFDTDQPELVVPDDGNPATNTVLSPAGSIAAGGGSRDMELSYVVPFPGIPDSAAEIDGGLFILGAGSDAVVTASITWTPPAPVNLLDGCPSLAECFLIFGVDFLDHQLSVTVTLSDGAISASNTYLKHNHVIPPDPLLADTLFCTNGAGDQCPQIVGSINGDPDTGVFGNYYHGLSLFLGGPTVDPATGLPFGGAPVNLAAITSIVFSLTTPDSALDFLVDCVYTGGRVGTGFETQPLPGGGTQTYPTFVAADGARNACTAQVTDIPEPASLLLMGTGLLGVGLFGLRKRSLRRRSQV